MYPSPPQDDPRGARFGKYRIVRRLGVGSYGDVYEALLPGPMGFAKRVALKRLRSHLVADDPRFLQSMINEARIGALLNHAHIVQTLEFDQVDGVHYLAMEYVDGATLEQIVDVCQRYRVLLPRFAVVDLAAQVCRGLQHAHELVDHDGRPLQLVHRDVKTSNIIVDRDGTARILDFGIAKAASNLFHNTLPGFAKGTPRFMSPEQMRGVTPLPPQSDLFSLGAVLFEMITARPLFRGESLMSLMHQVASVDIGDRLQEAEAAFPGSAEVLERALDRDPARRHLDARALAEQLRALGGRYPTDGDTGDVMRSLLPWVRNPGAAPVRDADDLARDERRRLEIDGVDEPLADAAPDAPIQPPPAGSSGLDEFAAALSRPAVAVAPGEAATSEDAIALSTADLETAEVPPLDPEDTPTDPPEGRPPVTTPVPPARGASDLTDDATPPAPGVPADPRSASGTVVMFGAVVWLLLAALGFAAGVGGLVALARWAPWDRGGAASAEGAPGPGPLDLPTGGGDGAADAGRGVEPGLDANPDTNTNTNTNTNPDTNPDTNTNTNTNPDTNTSTNPSTDTNSLPVSNTDTDTATVTAHGSRPTDTAHGSRPTDTDHAPRPTDTGPPALTAPAPLPPHVPSPGTLSLHVVQWSRIYVDDTLVEPQGNTLLRHPVDGGTHRVRVVCGAETCPCSELTYTEAVHVDGDDVRLSRLDFASLAHRCP